MNLQELKKLTPILQQNEEEIINNWISNESFVEVLSKHIVPEYFKDNYAHAIFKYFIDVINEHSLIGDCPAMRNFLHYCNIEDFKVDDIYTICINLRHSITIYLLQNNLINEIIYKQINFILDKNLAGLISIYNDIVESKNHTIFSQKQWINQYEKVIDEILIVSKANIKGKITYANDNFVKISGFTRSELLGKSHNIVRHPDMPKEVFRHMWETIISKKAWSGVIKNRRKDGSYYYASTIIIPILDENNEIIEFLSSRTDLTELFILKHKKEEQENLLLKQSVPAEMGNMISLISHQWKQPLSSINAIVMKLLLRMELNLESKEQNKKDYTHIMDLISHLSTTIDDFRTFYKENKLKKSVNITKIVNTSLSLIQARFSNLCIDTTVNDLNSFNITIFENNLKQVLLNIYINTADVIEEKKIKNGKLTISFEKNDDIGKIIIEDNGGGIPPNLLPEKLFNLHETTKGDEGTGIGLNLCKRIIEDEFFGTIYVANKNEGAIFTIELPLNID